MTLTPEKKAEIDAMTHRDLLAKWRFASVGNPFFQGETGAYYAARMQQLRDADPAQAVADSKAIGWRT